MFNKQAEQECCNHEDEVSKEVSINFNQNSVFNLKPIDVSEVRQDIQQLFVNDEEIVCAFKTIRDQLVFTNKRIIGIDVQGITGMKRNFAIMPYSSVQYFSIQTPGFAEIFADSELFLMFANGFTAKFEFRGAVDVAKLGRVIAAKIL